MKRVFSIRGLLLLTGVALSITPFYGLAYIIAIFAAVKTIKVSKTFSTVFGRIVLSALLLAATIMFTGIVAWLAHVETYPALVLIFFVLLLLLFKNYSGTDVSSSKFIDKSDVISISLALLAPLIIAVSFYLPRPSEAASYQLVSNNSDSASHIVMLETAALEKGYVYGNSKEIEDKVILHNAGSYPQAWHLATSNIAAGFGFNPFSPEHRLIVINSYIVVLFLWYVLAVYCFSKLAWRLLATIDSHSAPTLIGSLYITANLLIQLIVFWGALTYGFADYLGCLAYMILFATALTDSGKPTIPAYIMAGVAGSATVLCWVLPSPAIALAFITVFATIPLRKMLRPQRTLVPLYAFSVLTLFTMLFPILVLILYSGIGVRDRLDANGGVFVVQGSLLAAIGIFSMSYWLKVKPKLDDGGSKIIITIGSMAILSLGFYVYQMLTGGQTSYYLYKILGLLVALIGTAFIPAFVSVVSDFNKSKLPLTSTLLVGVGILGLLLMGTGQQTVAVNKLFQSSSRVSFSTADKIVDFLRGSTPSENLVVLRNLGTAEDANEFLFTKVAHTSYYNCLLTVRTSSNSTSLHGQLANLDKCADSLEDRQITVITSNATRASVASLHRKNISIVNVP